MDDTSGRVDIDVTRRPNDPGEEYAGRATESTRGYATTSERDDVDERTREIREEIAETRGEMSETIDAIQEKLKPRNIVADAADRVKSATTERVRDMADTASQTAQQAMDYTRERASGIVGTTRQNPLPLALIGVGAAWLLTNRSSHRGRYQDVRQYDRYGYERNRTREEGPWGDERDGGVMARLRQNPVPAALAGVGLTWLAFSGRDRGQRSWDSGRDRDYGDRWRDPASGPWKGRSGTGEAGSTAQELGDAASDMASRTREYASDTAESMRRMARRRQNQLERMVQENPLLVGAAALMLGAAFGMAVPETETENELMGDARDSMVGRAREMARDAATQVQQAAGSVAESAKNLADKAQP
jgi:Protein of unknown function (DUF3618)